MLLGILGLGLLGLLYMLTAERQPGLRLFIAAYLVTYLLVYGLSNGARLLMKRKKVSTENNRAVTIVVILVLSFAFASFITFFIGQRSSFAEAPREMVLIAQDLTGQEDPDSVKTVTHRASCFLSMTKARQLPPFDRKVRDFRSLDYTQVDVRFAPLYDLCLRQFIHEDDRYAYRSMADNAFGTDRAWQRFSPEGPQSTYLLCRGSRITVLRTDWLLTPKQMQTAGDALFPD